MNKSGIPVEAPSLPSLPRSVKVVGLAVVCREFSKVAQRPFDESAVVVDALCIHHGRVERLRVAHENVLRAIHNEQMSRPVGE